MWTPGDRPVDWCYHGRPSSLWCSGSRRLTCCSISPPPRAAACRTPLLFWSSREPHGIFTKTLGLHSCSHQTAVAACCRYCSCCFYTLANKVASVAEFPIVSFDVANDLVFITWSLWSEFISFNLVKQEVFMLHKQNCLGYKSLRCMIRRCLFWR